MKSLFCHGIGSNSWTAKMNGCERFGTLFWGVLNHNNNSGNDFLVE
jgi:hypothetical protein